MSSDNYFYIQSLPDISVRITVGVVMSHASWYVLCILTTIGGALYWAIKTNSNSHLEVHPPTFFYLQGDRNIFFQ